MILDLGMATLSYTEEDVDLFNTLKESMSGVYNQCRFLLCSRGTVARYTYREGTSRSNSHMSRRVYVNAV
jgi:hypothetical protein